MRRDPQRIADTVAWCRRVEEDLRAAEVDLGAHPPLLADAAFHCQQATEKALKALLTWHDVPFRRTHDLAELGQQCVSLDPSLQPACVRAERLTVYAWTFRYPHEDEAPKREEVEEGLMVARQVQEAILMRLPDGARS